MIKCVMCGDDIPDAKSSKRKYCLSCLVIYRKNINRNHYLKNKHKKKTLVTEKIRKTNEDRLTLNYGNGLKVDFTYGEIAKLHIIKSRKVYV